MAHMAGLGLGQPINFSEARVWLDENNNAALAQQAYFLGKDAYAGLYGVEKVKFGREWLQIAADLGSQDARLPLSKQ